MTSGLPASVKAGLALRGLDVGAPRRPLKALDVNGRALLKSCFEELSVGAMS